MIGFGKKPPRLRLDDADKSLQQSCKPPVSLPQRAVTQLEVETLWSKDRRNLVICKGRHDATVNYYLDRDAQLRATN